MSCPPPVDAAAAPCVAKEGEVGYSVFFLDFSGFDVPEGYFGIDGKATGHVFIEARRHTQSPPRPCIGATDLGRVGAGQWNTTAYDCSNNALTVQRIARHGEGAYVGHVLLNWNQDGIDYIASAHGQTAVNRALLVGLVQSMMLTPPK